MCGTCCYLVLSMLKLKFGEINYCAEGPQTRAPNPGSETPLPDIKCHVLYYHLVPSSTNRIYFMFASRVLYWGQSHIKKQKEDVNKEECLFIGLHASLFSWSIWPFTRHCHTALALWHICSPLIFWKTHSSQAFIKPWSICSTELVQIKSNIAPATKKLVGNREFSLPCL